MWDELIEPGAEPVPSDAELIAAVRGGDSSAYAELWTRHHAAVLRYAQQFVPRNSAEDLVSEAFARLLRLLQSGGGPDMNVRPYLLISVKRLRIDIATRYEKRVGLTGEHADLEVGSADGADDAALEALEARTVWRAYAALPERWQTVLWHTLIEEQSPATVAPILGASPNAVAALSMRAREGLRQAFLQAHVAESEREECHHTLSKLGAWERRALSAREAAVVDAHLETCEHCRAAALEVGDLNRSMRAIVLPVLLGGTVLAAKYLSSLGGSGAAAAGGGSSGALTGSTPSGATGSSTAGSATGTNAPASSSAASSSASGSGGHPLISGAVRGIKGIRLVGSPASVKPVILAGVGMAAMVTAAVVFAALPNDNHTRTLSDATPSARAGFVDPTPPHPQPQTPTKATTRPSRPAADAPVPPPSAATTEPPAAPPVSASRPARRSVPQQAASHPAPPPATAPSAPSGPAAPPPSTTPPSSPPPSTTPPSSPPPSTTPPSSPPPSTTPPASPVSRTLSFQLIPGGTPAPGSVTVTAPGNWQITSVTGAASDSCTATSANVWHCSTLLQHGDPAHVFTVVASAETANSGDAITIDYTDPWSDEHVAMSLG